MFTLSFSKILLTVLVVIVAWRGYRMLQQVQSRLATANERPAAPASAAKATDLVECVRCGLFVPNGTICRSREECRFRPS
jgi:hypothetical protein